MAAAEQQQRNAWIGIAFSAKPVLVKTAYQQVYVLVAVLAVFATVLPL